MTATEDRFESASAGFPAGLLDQRFSAGARHASTSRLARFSELTKSGFSATEKPAELLHRLVLPSRKTAGLTTLAGKPRERG